MLDADATLRFPDFRAEERTFALVAQLAGRSGRGERGGRVLVQTLAPEAPAIRHAAAHDAAGFLAGELERRRALRYPPFSHLVRVELTAPDAEPAQTGGGAARRRARGARFPDGTELLGPAPALPPARAPSPPAAAEGAASASAAVAAVRAAVEGLAAAASCAGWR